MRKAYRSPQLVEYGLVGEITLGVGGPLPDIVSGQVVNDTCPTQTFVIGTSTFTRTSCSVVGSP